MTVRKKRKLATENDVKPYFDPKQPASYAGISTFSKHYQLRDVGEILNKYPAYTMHKPTRKRFKRNRVIVNSIDQQWQVDLSDLSSLAPHNDGYRYLACFIDVLSKKVWVVPMKKKTALDMMRALDVVFDSTARRPMVIQVDKGTEFHNATVKKKLEKMGIRLFSTHNEETKAQIVERFQRTLKGKMWRYFHHNNTYRYVDVLDDIVASYNNTVHRSIKMTPNQVNEDNEATVWETLYGDENLSPPQPYRYKVGDHVRILSSRVQFRKGYETGWTEEIFKIIKRVPRNPPVYKVEDLMGETLEGTFYGTELQKVNMDNDVFIVEKVLKRRRRPDGRTEYFVRWRGYPKKFDSWTADLMKL